MMLPRRGVSEDILFSLALVKRPLPCFIYVCFTSHMPNAKPNAICKETINAESNNKRACQYSRRRLAKALYQASLRATGRQAR